MDAKTRYRRRLKLQAALARVMQGLAANLLDEIRPDRTTAIMAAQVIRQLTHFAREAGLSPAEAVPDQLDLSRFSEVIKARRNATNARYRRRVKRVQRLRKVQPAGSTDGPGNSPA